MKTAKFVLPGLIGFLLLNLYAVFIPFVTNNFPEWKISQAFAEIPSLWILYWLGFFPLAFLVARFLLRFKGLSGFGFSFRDRWKKQLFIGLTIGLGLKLFQYLLFYSFGKFEITGIAQPSVIAMIFVFGTLIAIFPSIINDLTIRGFLLGYFHRLRLMKWFVPASAVLYALDDIWNEGLDPANMVFSLIYGISLGYTVYKTGAIWVSAGLHIGGNFIYQMLNGINGNGVFVLENVTTGAIFENINILMALLLFPIVYLTLNFRKAPTIPSPPGTPAVPE